MNIHTELNEYQLAILNYIAIHKKKHQKIVDEFQTKHLTKSAIKSVLLSLVQLGYIKPVEINKSQIQYISLGEPHQPPETEKGYKITEMGKHRLNTSKAGNSISVGDNVNFALNSPGARQSIDITEFNEGVQIQISEMQDAIRANDKPRFLGALEYILDKGVDIAIVLMLAQAGLAK